MKKLLGKSLMLPALLATVPGAAQVYLPDTVLRNALNMQVPGLVDGAGIMDLSNPDISGITELSLDYYWDASLIDLEGISSLPALQNMAVISEVSETSEVIINDLPASLTHFVLDVRAGTVSLDTLPASIERVLLRCYEEFIEVSIASMPDTLNELYIMGDVIVTIDDPGFIREFTMHNYGNYGLSGTFDWLNGLACDVLHVSSNGASIVDLQSVSCEHLILGECHNDLVFLPANLRTLFVVNIELNEIASFPASLEELHLVLTEGSLCLPLLPEGLQVLELDSCTSCLPNWPASLATAQIDGETYDQGTVNYCSVLNSICPGANSHVSGSFFNDMNMNGLQDADEPGWGFGTVQMSPGGAVSGGPVDGSWMLGTMPGTYTITPFSANPYVQAIQPVVHTAAVPNLGDVDTDNNFAVTLIPNIQDLRVTLHADPARPGFDNRLYLTCQNYGSAVVDAELTLIFDLDQTWVGSSVAPDMQMPSIAIWNFPAMPIGAQQTIAVDLNTSASVPNETDLMHSLVAEPMATDETLLDNVVVLHDSVVGSFDPNDKLLDPKELTPYQISLSVTPIEYTIRFQNTGTYLAERVVILDTLSEDLQWETMRFIASSHPCHWYITDGVLHVIHNDIMLPDSTSDEANSHGFVKFSMLPANDLQDGVEIVNVAHIVFDFNEPVITPPAIFRVDVEAAIQDIVAPASLLLQPNPAHDRIQVRMDKQGALRYRITDMLGQSIQRGSTTANNWLDVSQLAPGPYVMEVERDGLSTSQRFVKQ